MGAQLALINDFSTNYPAPIMQNITPATAERFLQFVDASEKTIATYTRSIKQFISFLIKNDIDRPTRADVILYRDQLKAKCKPSTVQSYMVTVRLFFRWLAQEGLYPNIADHVKGAKLSREHKKDYMTAEQVKQLMQTIDMDTEKGQRDYAIIATTITGGLRTIEIERANIGDLRTVAGKAALYIQGKGRTEKAEYIFLSAEVDRAIRTYLMSRGTSEPTAPLFASTSNNNHDGRMTTRAISGSIKERLIGAGFNSSYLTAHSLRHTAATLNLLAGGTLEETQQLLRHSNISTTMIYAHHLARENNKSEERISSAIFN